MTGSEWPISDGEDTKTPKIGAELAENQSKVWISDNLNATVPRAYKLMTLLSTYIRS